MTGVHMLLRPLRRADTVAAERARSQASATAPEWPNDDPRTNTDSVSRGSELLHGGGHPGCVRDEPPITRASLGPVNELHTPYRLQTDILALAIAAEHAAWKEPALPRTADETPRSAQRTESQVAQKGQVYVEVPPAPYNTSRPPSTLTAIVRILRGPGGVYPVVTHEPRVLSEGSKKAVNDKARSHARRVKKARERDAKDIAVYGALRRHDKPSVFTVLGRARPIDINVQLAFDHTNRKLRTFPVASTGWIGARVTHTDEDRTPHGLDWYLARGFQYMPCEGKNLLLVLDANGHVIFGNEGKPRQVATWMDNHDQAVELLEDAAGPNADVEPRNRRNTKARTFGVTVGGGETQPPNFALGKHEDAVNFLRNHEVFKRIAAYMDRGFKTFQPELYSHYEDYMGKIRRAYPELRFNFDRNVFAAATFNLGPQSIASVHTDAKNLAYGWCAIMALGDFDPTKGGHMVLWDLKLVMEFPPGTVMFIPSAILRHSNTTIAPHEKRMSFTQFTPGGLFRWVDCGMQTQKNFFAQGHKHAKTGAERWLDGIKMYSTWSSLQAKTK